ncbi:hypothetical protein FLK61_24860 [Paenalkalicoccus suaedae]|uniref:Uncharacterized protein n=1 Tax=Paenalkalicoccus suaedae TaxID=2592382 RepID=A0A859FB32_9BACI|nr:hypothetical protein [Paenalkalicoccus suaedae]QKS70008.1 hypothetical protein FLK61_24860 [Paenalkalicoccus suaedae]
MSQKKDDKPFDDGFSEALRGLGIGMVMMIVFFLLLHFVFGVQAFA